MTNSSTPLSAQKSVQPNPVRRFKIKGLRWIIITLIALATVINYIDRNALSIMWPGISHDLGLNKDDYAWMITWFMVAYALGQTFMGKLMDAIGTRLGFAFSIFIWSVSIALHNVVKGLHSFGIVRFTLGFGEAGNWPGAAKSNAEWFPARERAIGQGIFNAGAAIGGIISAPLVAALYVRYGWRITFLCIGALGLIWLIPWLIFNKKSPDKHPWLTDSEKAHIHSDSVTAAGAAAAEDLTAAGVQNHQKAGNAGAQIESVYSWKELLRFRATWSVILSRFFLDPVWWLFVNWLPIYLSEKFLFDIKSIGAFAWVPYVGAAIGSLTGGAYSSHVLRRGKTAVKARMQAITWGCVIMLPALVLTAYADSPAAAIGLISLILFGFQFAISNIQTLPSDFFNGKNVGTVTGMSGTAAVAGTLLTTWIVPVITAHNYFWFFLLGALLVPLAYISLWWFSRPIKRLKG